MTAQPPVKPLHAQADRKTRVVSGDSVSVLMVRTIKPGLEKEFWALEAEMEAAVAGFPGFSTVSHLPTAASENEFMTVLQFDSVENLARWQESRARDELLERVDALVEGDVRRKSVTGLEGLFETSPMASPKRYKMTIVLTGVILGMILTLRPLVALAIGDMPPLIQTVAMVVIQVSLMMYLVMPLVTRLLSGWLYR